MGVICDLGDNYNKSDTWNTYWIYLNENWLIKYKDYKIIFLIKKHYIKLRKLDEEISFLYADKQEININENNDSYELKFKKKFYYNIILVIAIHLLKNF